MRNTQYCLLSSPLKLYNGGVGEVEELGQGRGAQLAHNLNRGVISLDFQSLIYDIVECIDLEFDFYFLCLININIQYEF